LLKKTKKTIIVNIGTGTSIIQMKNWSVSRITGTAIGGGTFEGLAEIVLKNKHKSYIETLNMGLQGKLEA